MAKFTVTKLVTAPGPVPEQQLITKASLKQWAAGAEFIEKARTANERSLAGVCSVHGTNFEHGVVTHEVYGTPEVLYRRTGLTHKIVSVWTDEEL